ncbi:hypothetical protein [Streptomyces sp. NPDC001621]|uniref:hypothetical protein n=1 Tax=Streptomyces sp. NPDC001621 TaxID=3364594 RepID=UPI00367A2C19
MLAVHGDVLRNRVLVESLRAAARDSSVHGHLVVARHSYGSAALDASTPDSGPVLVQPNSGGVFWVTQDESARRPDIWADLETRRQFLADLRSEDPERRRQAMELLSPQRPADPTEADLISYEDMRTALQDPATLRAVQAKAAELQAATEQRLRQAAEAMHPGRAAGSLCPRPLHPSRDRARRSTDRTSSTPGSLVSIFRGARLTPRPGLARCGAPPRPALDFP